MQGFVGTVIWQPNTAHVFTNALGEEALPLLAPSAWLGPALFSSAHSVSVGLLPQPRHLPPTCPVCSVGPQLPNSQAAVSWPQEARQSLGPNPPTDVPEHSQASVGGVISGSSLGSWH